MIFTLIYYIYLQRYEIYLKKQKKIQLNFNCCSHFLKIQGLSVLFYNKKRHTNNLVRLFRCIIIIENWITYSCRHQSG